jgi:DNA polymerase-3 subunit delta'
MQNKLLKTLEEPPANTVFFLGVTNESLVLDTVRSRCLHIAVDQIPFDGVVKYLTKKGISHGDAVIASAVSFSQPLKAESYASNKRFFAMFDDVIDVVANLTSSRESLNAVSRLIKYKEQAQELFDMLLAVFREAVVCETQSELLLLDRKKNDIITIAEKFSVTALIKAIDFINESKQKIDVRCNFNAVLDGLVLSILEVKHKCPK